MMSHGPRYCGRHGTGSGAGLRPIAPEVLVPPMAGMLREQGRSPFMLPALAWASGLPRSRGMGTPHESARHPTKTSTPTAAGYSQPFLDMIMLTLGRR